MTASVDGPARPGYRAGMGKGAETKALILDHAIRVASTTGLEGLTLGRLAGDLQLSKSGLFAHFASKEALQAEVLDRAAARFVEVVMRPALARPRGEPRVLALLERWMRWPVEVPQPGGCIFVHAAAELDDRPGPARDRLVALQRDWLGALATAVRGASQEGHFREDVDAEQIAFELLGIMLAMHLTGRLLDDPRARARARRAIERVFESCRPTRRA